MAKRKKKKNKNMKPGTNPHAHKQHQQKASPAATTTKNTEAGTHASQGQSLAQKRAKHALAAIKTIDNSYDKYVSYVSGLPATIIMSGLGQALAMLKAGKKPGHGILFLHMQSWLCNKDNKGWQNSPYKDKNDVLDAIVSKGEAEYIQAQAEAIEYLEWLKKFAVAFLQGEDE